MNAVKTKLKSNRGASITFALLLFLVCAVISGVVIVAATAAAGRMSEQSDMDERYYAVTAVAKKLKTVMENNGEEVTLSYPKANPSDITVVAPAGAGSILSSASKGVLLGEDLQKVPASGSIVFTNGDDVNTVECTISGELGSDGTLVFDIKAVTAKNKRTYDLKMTFGSTLKRASSDSSVPSNTATVKWKLLNVEKGRPDRNLTAGG